VGTWSSGAMATLARDTVPGGMMFRFRMGGFLCDDLPRTDGRDAVAVPRRRRLIAVRARVSRRHGLGCAGRIGGVNPAHLAVNRVGDLARRKCRPFLIRTGLPHRRIGLLEHRISHCETSFCETWARCVRKQNDPLAARHVDDTTLNNAP